MADAASPFSAATKADSEKIIEERLKDPASRRKLAQYAASYLRDMRECNREAAPPMLERIERILKAIGEGGAT